MVTARALLLLEQLPDVGPVTVRRLVRRFGSATAALRAAEGRFAAVAGSEAARARRDPEVARRVDAALDAAGRLGMEVVTWDDDPYPGRLGHLADPPPVLFLRGRTALLEARPMVTIVGARRSTARARSVAERLAATLARSGACVVSGLALGVDGSAHAGALRVGGDTVAVLGAGADVPYPRFHRRLHERVARDGLLVSEFLPGTRAAPHHFPRRNRILAALAGTVVVVEAGVRSGSLITVDHALDLGREIWSVPGPIDAATCRGSNRLLVDGARPLVSIDAFVDEVTRRPDCDRDRERGAVGAGDADRRGGGRDHATAAAGDGGQTTLFDPRPPTDTLEARVLEILREGTAGVDELAGRLDAPVGAILALLTTLELHGEVERLDGMRFRRAA